MIFINDHGNTIWTRINNEEFSASKYKHLIESLFFSYKNPNF